MTLCNLSDLDFGLSKSLEIKSDNVAGLPICSFLLMVNSNKGPNSALYEI